MEANLRLDLAKQMHYYLVENTEEELLWTDTKTHLVELVKYIYDLQMMVDDFGLPYTMMQITKLACQRFNVTVPRNVSTFLHNISSMKGRRSMSLLDTCIFLRSHRGKAFSITTCFTTIEKTHPTPPCEGGSLTRGE